jgi:hypothetical protein
MKTFVFRLLLNTVPEVTEKFNRSDTKILSTGLDNFLEKKREAKHIRPYTNLKSPVNSSLPTTCSSVYPKYSGLVPPSIPQLW